MHNHALGMPVMHLVKKVSTMQMHDTGWHYKERKHVGWHTHMVLTMQVFLATLIDTHICVDCESLGYVYWHTRVMSTMQMAKWMLTGQYFMPTMYLYVKGVMCVWNSNCARTPTYIYI